MRGSGLVFCLITCALVSAIMLFNNEHRSKKMSICRKRLIMWLVLTSISVVVGIVIDIVLRTESFPVLVRFAGLIGMILAHFPLKRTGRLLILLGEQKEWGCTNRLITTDIYKCVRHPHHLGVGIFMTSLGLLIGHVWSFLIITITQWVWIVAFLFLVEEKELSEKFGEEYKAYSRKVPMLFPKLFCFFSVFTKSIEEARDKEDRGAAS
jgi:protein-S-isoprenylcysteine O-methyltransferase Ste14